MFDSLWIAVFFGFLYLTGGGFSNGSPISSQLLVLSGGLLVLIYYLIQRRPIRMISFAGFLLPLLYLLPIVAGRYESLYGAWTKVIQMAAYGSFFFLATSLYGGKLVRNEGRRGLWLLSGLVSVSTMAGLAGLVHPERFWLNVPDGLAGSPARLGSYLDYPNAFALLCCVFFLLHGLSAVRFEGREQSFHLVMLLPYALFLLLTESRAVWALTGLMVLVGLWLLNRQQQWNFLLVAAVSLAAAVLFQFQSEQFISGSLFWTLLLVAVSGAISWGFGMKGARLPSAIEKLSGAWAAWLLTVAVVLDLWFHGLLFRLLPQALQSRLEMGGDSLSDRVLYWQDAMQASDRFLWTGAGGNAWPELMYQVQSAPYISHSLHSAWMTSLVEVGVIGTLVFLLAAGAGAWQLLKSRSLWAIPFAAILLHSFVDFSLSFDFMVYLLILLYVMAEKQPLLRKSFSEQNLKIGKPAAAALFSGISLMAVILFIRFQLAEQHFQQGDLARAIELNPYEVNYRLAEGSPAVLEKALWYTPHQSYVLYQLALLHDETGQTEAAEKRYTRALQLDRFDIGKANGYAAFLRSQGREKEAVELEERYLKLQKRKFPVRDQRGFTASE